MARIRSAGVTGAGRAAGDGWLLAASFMAGPSGIGLWRVIWQGPGRYPEHPRVSPSGVTYNVAYYAARVLLSSGCWKDSQRERGAPEPNRPPPAARGRTAPAAGGRRAHA